MRALSTTFTKILHSEDESQVMTAWQMHVAEKCFSTKYKCEIMWRQEVSFFRDNVVSCRKSGEYVICHFDNRSVYTGTYLYFCFVFVFVFVSVIVFVFVFSPTWVGLRTITRRAGRLLSNAPASRMNSKTVDSLKWFGNVKTMNKS